MADGANYIAGLEREMRFQNSAAAPKTPGTPAVMPTPVPAPVEETWTTKKILIVAGIVLAVVGVVWFLYSRKSVPDTTVAAVSGPAPLANVAGVANAPKNQNSDLSGRELKFYEVIARQNQEIEKLFEVVSLQSKLQNQIARGIPRQAGGSKSTLEARLETGAANAPRGDHP